MPERQSESDFEAEQEESAAAEAGAIGGRVSSDAPTELEAELSESERAVSEGGGGESEGFELAEAELQEHAAHGDEHAAGRVLDDAARLDEGERERGEEGGEGDAATPPDA